MSQNKDPNHKIIINKFKGQVRIERYGITLSETYGALEMLEHTYDPVIYMPLKDIKLENLKVSDFTSYCPYKGIANYWHLIKNGRVVLENIAWQYKNPIEEMKEITEYLCFYKDLVTTSINKIKTA